MLDNFYKNEFSFDINNIYLFIAMTQQNGPLLSQVMND